MSTATIALLFMVLTWLLPPVVAGHSVHVFAYVENGMIKGEGSLAGGRKVKNGEIKVVRKDSQELLLGLTTDDTGQFGLSINQLGLQEPADLIIILEAGPGHRSEWHLEAQEYDTMGAAQTLSPTQPKEGVEKEEGPQPSSTLRNAVLGVACIIGLGALVNWSKKRREKR